MQTMRREYLRGYLFALFSEGEFGGLLGQPSAMLRRAAEMFVKDVPAVLTSLGAELANQAAQAGGSIRAKVGAAVLSRMDEVVKDIDQRGVRAVWGDLMDVYRRGVETQGGRR